MTVNQEGAPPTGGVVEVSVHKLLVGKEALAAARKKKAADRTPEEAAAVRKYDADAQKRTRKKANKANFVYNSGIEPTKHEAKDLLTARGITNHHVVDVVYKALVREAAAQDIPANRFLFANGMKQALLSYEKKEARPLQDITPDYVETELLNRAELYALYDACVATHEDCTFEQYLELRLRCKQDCWFLGKHILDKDLAQCHRD